MGVSWEGAWTPDVIPRSNETRQMKTELERGFPGVVAWYGERTGSWWALVPLRGGARLVEAVSADELRQAIAQASTWPWPR